MRFFWRCQRDILLGLFVSDWGRELAYNCKKPIDQNEVYCIKDSKFYISSHRFCFLLNRYQIREIIIGESLIQFIVLVVSWLDQIVDFLKYFRTFLLLLFRVLSFALGCVWTKFRSSQKKVCVVSQSESEKIRKQEWAPIFSILLTSILFFIHYIKVTTLLTSNHNTPSERRQWWAYLCFDNCRLCFSFTQICIVLLEWAICNSRLVLFDFVPRATGLWKVPFTNAWCRKCFNDIPIKKQNAYLTTVLAALEPCRRNQVKIFMIHAARLPSNKNSWFVLTRLLAAAIASHVIRTYHGEPWCFHILPLFGIS